MSSNSLPASPPIEVAALNCLETNSRTSAWFYTSTAAHEYTVVYARQEGYRLNELDEPAEAQVDGTPHHVRGVLLDPRPQLQDALLVPGQHWAHMRLINQHRSLQTRLVETDTAARYPCLGEDEPETEHELGLVVERNPTAVAIGPHMLPGYQKIKVSVTNSAQCSSPRTVQYCSHGFISWARRLHSAWYVLNAGYTWHVAWLHTALCMVA